MRSALPLPDGSPAKVTAFPTPAEDVPSVPAPTASRLRNLWSRVGTSSTPTEPVTDPAADFILAFPSEEEAATRTSGPPSTQPRERAARSPRRLTWTHITIALVAVIALAQAGLIAVWLQSGRVSLLPPTGSVLVSSAPTGAAVFVDDVERGVTPFAASLSSGAHRIEVRHGAAVRTQTVNVARGGEGSVHVDLRSEPPAVAAVASTGGLQISTEPGGAQVSVDSRPYGVAPVSVSSLEAGNHVVTVTGPSGTMTRRVTVQAGTVSSLIIAMNGASEFASGTLAVSSRIPAQIFENGTLLGSTDTPRILLAAGRHDLEFSNAALGYRVRRAMQISPGRTTSLTLEVPSGTLHINALPWAEVWVDGRSVGETPIANLSMPIGNHELTFRHPELGEQRKTVVVGTGAPARVGIDLRKGQQ